MSDNAAPSPHPTPSPGAFGAQVKAYRMRLGLNQRQLATAVSLDFGYMSKIENKGLVPSRDVIEALAKALKLRGDERDDFIMLGGAIPETTEEIVRDPQARQLLRSLREMPTEARAKMLDQLIDQVRNERRGGGE